MTTAIQRPASESISDSSDYYSYSTTISTKNSITSENKQSESVSSSTTEQHSEAKAETKSPKELIQDGTFFTVYKDINQIKTVLKENELTYDESIKILDQLKTVQIPDNQDSKILKVYKFKIFKYLKIKFDNKLVNIHEFIKKANTVLELSVLASMEQFLTNLQNDQCDLRLGATPEQAAEIQRLRNLIDQKKAEIRQTNKNIQNLSTEKPQIELEGETAEKQINDIQNDINTFKSGHQKIFELEEFDDGIDVEIANESQRAADIRKSANNNWQEINKSKRKFYQYFKKDNSDEQFSDLISSGSAEGGVKMTKFGFHLLCLLIVIGGITLSGPMVCSSPYEFETTKNILFYALPMFGASIPPFVYMFMKLLCDEDEKTIFFISDKRILISVIDLVFVGLTIGLHFSPKVVPLHLLIRTLQGFVVGIMSFVYPMTLRQVASKKKYKTYLAVYFVFFGLGIFLFRTIGVHWIKIICIIPFLQGLLIWVSNDNNYKEIDLSRYIFYKESNDIYVVQTIATFIVHAFIGSITFWIGLYRFNYDYLSIFKYTITFISPLIVFTIIFRFFTNEIWERFTIYYYILSDILYFIGCGIGLGLKDTIGFYLMAVASGSGLFFLCWDHYFILRKANPVSTMAFSWSLFWFVNGFSAVLYLMTTPFIWFIVGASVLGLYILSMIICVIFYNDHYILDFDLRSDNEFFNTIIYCLSAIAIGAAVVGKCNLKDDYYVMIYHTVPLFGAAFASLITVLFKICLDYKYIFIFENRELQLMVFNIIFIISTAIVGYLDNPIIVLVFRGIEGIAIGFLAFLSSIMISELQKEFFSFYLGSFAVGLSIGNCILEKWPILALLASSLQAMTICFLEPNKATDFDFDCELFTGKEYEWATPILTTLDAFVGVIGIFIYNSRNAKSYLDAFYYDIAFCAAAIMSIVIFYFIFNENDGEPLTLLYHYLSIVVLLVGFVLYYLQITAGLYVIGAGIGFGAFNVPWACFISDNYYGPSFIFAWGCFWIANGSAAFLYLKVRSETWAVIGWISMTVLVGIAALAGYVLFTKAIRHNCALNNSVFWCIFLGLGGILVGTIIAPGIYDDDEYHYPQGISPDYNSSDFSNYYYNHYYEEYIEDHKSGFEVNFRWQFGSWGKFSSYPPLFALVGAGITILIDMCVLSDLRILFTIANFAYILFTGLMIIGGIPMIVFKYLQSVAIGSFSILIPLMMRSVASSEGFYHAISFYLLMIPVGMLIVSYVQIYYMYFVHALPLFYIILIWFSDEFDYECDDADGSDDPTYFDMALALAAPFYRGFCCNCLWVYHYKGMGKFVSMLHVILGVVFAILYGMCVGCDYLDSTCYTIFKFQMGLLYLAAGIVAVIFIGDNSDRTPAIAVMAAAYSFGIFQLPYLRSANNHDAFSISMFTLMNWFSSTISSVMWYYIPRITSIIVLVGCVLFFIARFIRWICH
ncbi:hypothetical protein TVAG_108300 [Trichomonas vaginalis G3]|uniref:Uncharacterized protein n=1 Tax=Trichomonas vaginalis (strain ATCC PRA-98 / G3) TaxID=412133 RepID=A2EQF4_TRIV3|nr:Major Facilitator Superfamily (MFS) general substrate transporter family [Trichomonas vaginalis G3]EAY05096.1 hypothetical protein TVAG_108300 [Trichomonas vaginalis G3]KAI5551474.1 Major Facilitator Superfamily (MFS) general substrate transporter family [Trichomonas vaginalis G3]|eukprot:XP_001317319.1 hypothetical protein [Trichomonas vaginalis G3]